MQVEMKIVMTLCVLGAAVSIVSIATLRNRRMQNILNKIMWGIGSGFVLVSLELIWK